VSVCAKWLSFRSGSKARSSTCPKNKASSGARPLSARVTRLGGASNVLGLEVGMDMGFIGTLVSPTKPTAQVSLMRDDESSAVLPR